MSHVGLVHSFLMQKIPSLNHLMIFCTVEGKHANPSFFETVLLNIKMILCSSKKQPFMDTAFVQSYLQTIFFSLFTLFTLFTRSQFPHTNFFVICCWFFLCVVLRHFMNNEQQQRNQLTDFQWTSGRGHWRRRCQRKQRRKRSEQETKQGNLKTVL